MSSNPENFNNNFEEMKSSMEDANLKIEDFKKSIEESRKKIEEIESRMKNGYKDEDINKMINKLKEMNKELGGGEESDEDYKKTALYSFNLQDQTDLFSERTKMEVAEKTVNMMEQMKGRQA